MIREEDLLSYLREERAKTYPKGRPPSWGINAYWDGYNAALGMVIDQMQARIDDRPAAGGEGEKPEFTEEDRYIYDDALPAPKPERK